MASYEAIAATSEALRRYLQDSPHEGFPQLDVALYRPSDFQNAVPSGGLVSLFLYRIGVNSRNLAAKTSADGTTLYGSPVAVDLFYLVSAWALNADYQQRLLGWVIRALADCPTLPAAMLNVVQTEPVFRETETVHVFCEPPSLQDLNVFWELIKPNPPLSVTYVARMIELESRLPLRQPALVQARGFSDKEPGGGRD